ncbi:MAG TPA: AmmeMemoRadiSam system protein B [Balneolales bacterium]|nr:AmmeMemoRadiSam system protein B [Balneolales bacterium]
MNIISFSKEKIKEGLEKAKSKDIQKGAKILFAPIRINDDNFEEACEVYASIMPGNYDTVVILEGVNHELEKKLPLPSVSSFKTPFGEVPVNDKLRNEFCDEEDDFFIDDEALDETLSIYQQLPMLQCTLNDFDVVSIQISNYERTSIIRELTFVLDEVLLSKNALIVVCCEMENDQKESLDRLKQYVIDGQISNLFNIINVSTTKIHGRSPFLVGLMIASSWELTLNFNESKNGKFKKSLITGYASLRKN